MKTALTHLAVAFAVCAIAIGGLVYWYGVVGTQSVEVARLADEIAVKAKTVDGVASARAMLADITKDETLIINHFIPESGAVPFIEDLEARGRALKADVAVSSVTTSGSGANSALSLALVVTGTFDAVVRTVGSIEYAPYAITVSSLTLTKDAKDSWRADLKITAGTYQAKKP